MLTFSHIHTAPSLVAPPFKHWPPGLPYAQNCPAFINGPPPPVRNQSHDSADFSPGATTRFGINDTVLGQEVSTCEDILFRGYYPTEPLSAEEGQFPLAFSRIIYRDYVLIERILGVIYQPQNFYCLAVDAKADALFRQRLYQLAKCMPKENVIVVELGFNVDSSGMGVSGASMACMRELERAGVYRYVLLMQVGDVNGGL